MSSCVMCKRLPANPSGAFCSVECAREWDKKAAADIVNRPAHYASASIECIDAMRAALGDEAVENFCVANAFKYIWRHQRKNGMEDLRKAIFYLRFATGDDPRADT